MEVKINEWDRGDERGRESKEWSDKLSSDLINVKQIRLKRSCEKQSDVLIIFLFLHHLSFKGSDLKGGSNKKIIENEIKVIKRLTI